MSTVMARSTGPRRRVIPELHPRIADAGRQLWMPCGHRRGTRGRSVLELTEGGRRVQAKAAREHRSERT